jgi:hypothetical protein
MIVVRVCIDFVLSRIEELTGFYLNNNKPKIL